MAVQQLNAEMINLLSSTFQKRNEPQFALGNAVSSYVASLGLVGFWPMSSTVRPNGNILDLSGAGRTLIINGNPTFDLEGLMPYVALDGVGDFFTLADAPSLDITGTEAYIATKKGLTIAAWCRPAAHGAILSKWLTTGNQRSYDLESNTFQVSSNGTAVTSVALSPALNVWQFLAGRFTPSTELASWVNEAKTVNTTAIPASIFAGTAGVNLGSIDAGAANLITGRLAMVVLCAAALPDVVLFNLYQQTRTAFGV